MKTAAIIAEYNPFHNGHKYHIEETRKICSADGIIAVMSGNFTQRGDVAITDKWQRTETALKNGADLIIELPAASVLGSAEQFALGAVTIINALGNVDYLSFGSECGNIELLKETAGAVHYCTEHDNFLGYMRRGLTYPAALEKAMAEFYDDEIVKTISTPNNTLGIEYLKAINETGSSVKPVTIKRYGAKHDSDYTSSDTVASASQLRKMLIKNSSGIEKFMPETDIENYANLAKLETAILAKLRSMSAHEIQKAPNVLQGLENRIYKAVRRAKSLPELMLMIKTKRYTMARLRRIILCCFLGITKDDAKLLPQYIRILGMNEKGKEIISSANCLLPIDTSLSALSKTGKTAFRQAVLEEHAGNIYALSLLKPYSCGIDFTHKPIII